MLFEARVVIGEYEESFVYILVPEIWLGFT
jgi:hypothetical protein